MRINKVKIGLGKRGLGKIHPLIPQSPPSIIKVLHLVMA